MISLKAAFCESLKIPPVARFPSEAGGNEDVTPQMAAPLTCGHFLTPLADAAGGGRAAIMDKIKRDDAWADKIGKTISAILIALLIAIFVYGYFAHLAWG